jgi:hypothetical protein
MDPLRVRSVLLGVARIKAADDADLVEYLSGVIADCDAKKPEDLSDAIGPFLESNGCCDGSAAVTAVCTEIFGKLVSSGLLKLAQPATAAASASAPSRLSEEPPAEPLTRALGAPVKLGVSASADSSTLDILWGKESNAFLQQNSEIDRESHVATSKRALRDARKDADKAAVSRDR